MFRFEQFQFGLNVVDLHTGLSAGSHNGSEKQDKNQSNGLHVVANKKK
jgi:hypothetical protein